MSTLQHPHTSKRHNTVRVFDIFLGCRFPMKWPWFSDVHMNKRRERRMVHANSTGNVTKTMGGEFGSRRRTASKRRKKDNETSPLGPWATMSNGVIAFDEKLYFSPFPYLLLYQFLVLSLSTVSIYIYFPVDVFFFLLLLLLLLYYFLFLKNNSLR